MPRASVLIGVAALTLFALALAVGQQHGRWPVFSKTVLLAAQPPAAAEPPFYADKTNLLVYLDARGHAQPIASPADWSRRREHILANFQLVAGPLREVDPLVPLDVAIEQESPGDGYRLLRLSYQAEPGDRVPAYLLLPSEGQGPFPAVLCLHQTTAIGKGQPAGLDDRENLHYAKQLAQRGYVTLAVDYPRFGDYQVDPYALGYVSATMKGIVNHRRAIDLLVARPDVDAARIGVIGHSLGGHNSLFVALFDERIRAVVTCCGFCSFAHYQNGDLTGWSHAGYMPRIQSRYGARPQRMPFDFTEVLAALAPRAVLVVAPEHDDNFAVEGVRVAVDAAQGVYRLLAAEQRLAAIYPDCEHDFPPEARQAAYAWFDHWLPPAR